jgi:uncharacterized protein (DUF2062 family)
MARKFIKRFMPDPKWIKQQKSLHILGDWIHDPNMWHLTRHSVAAAVFIGLFVAFIPLPGQMVIAALLSIIFRANLPVAIILVWVSNPLTIAPIFYLAYKVGAVFIGPTEGEFNFELSWQWLTDGLIHHWQPFLLGCILCGLFAGLLGSTMARMAWRRHTLNKWRERCFKRQEQQK